MKGKVYLVGAGPGHLDLLTVKGKKLIEETDVLVYDRLVGDEIVMLAKHDCELIYVGKKSNQHTMKQEDINQLLVDKAKENKSVLRLKGGDPYVFGRGGEEGIVLHENHIPFEVIPGITSAIGGLCHAGIPITHRDIATSFHVFTGHLRNDENEHNWEVLSKLEGTLVFLMGMSNLSLIVKELINNNKAKNTPVAIVHWATHAKQKVVVGDLESIVDQVKAEGIGSPSLIVIGDVVNLREHLNFKDNLSLFGQKVLVTRATAQSHTLKRKLENLGAEVYLKPMIKINKLPLNDDISDVIHSLQNYKYIVFTSVNGVSIFFEHLNTLNYDSRHLFDTKIVAIGGPTEDALLKHGIKADLKPNRFVAEGLIDLLKPLLNAEDQLLIPRAKNARPLLVDELSRYAKLRELHLYETISSETELREDLIESMDYITFTSASTVSAFSELYKGSPVGKIVSIGPITSDKLVSKGFKVGIQAKTHTIDGMVESIVEDTRRKS